MNKVFKNELFGFEVTTRIVENDKIEVLVDDMARGLGFTTVAKSGNEVIRWRRVNGYYNEFKSIIASCGDGELHSGDWISEGLFYMFAMKGRSEKARQFQTWISFEVLPQLRQEGRYELVDGEGTKSTYGKVAKEVNAICSAYVTSSDITEYLADNGYFEYVKYRKANGELENRYHKQPTDKFINEVVKLGYAETKEPDKRGKILHSPTNTFADWFIDKHLIKFNDYISQIQGQLNFFDLM